MSESNHRQFYGRWAQLMKAESWAEVPAAMDGPEPGMSGMNEDVTREVEQFLYREARLLDERRFHEWLELLTDDVRYWMGSRTNRYPKRSKAIAILNPDRYVEDDLGKEDELAILDETKQTLSQRVARLDTGMAWAEDPPSRSRHLITNVEVEPGDAAGEVKALLEFHGLPQPGGDRRTFTSVPARTCSAASPAPGRSPGRKIILDQNVLLAKNVSIFF